MIRDRDGFKLVEVDPTTDRSGNRWRTYGFVPPTDPRPEIIPGQAAPQRAIWPDPDSGAALDQGTLRRRFHGAYLTWLGTCRDDPAKQEHTAALVNRALMLDHHVDELAAELAEAKAALARREGDLARLLAGMGAVAAPPARNDAPDVTRSGVAYLCHIPGCGEPSFEHPDETSALLEAGRLVRATGRNVRIYHWVRTAPAPQPSSPAATRSPRNDALANGDPVALFADNVRDWNGALDSAKSLPRLVAPGTAADQELDHICLAGDLLCVRGEALGTDYRRAKAGWKAALEGWSKERERVKNEARDIAKHLRRVGMVAEPDIAEAVGLLAIYEEKARKRVEELNDEIAELADFIANNIPGEPLHNEGAVATAIRWMREAKRSIERLSASLGWNPPI